MRPSVPLILNRALLLALLTGCSGGELSTFDLSDREDVVAFVAVLGHQRQVLRVTRVFGVQDGKISFGDRPQLTLTGDEVDAVLVELDQAALAAAHPDYDRARTSELSVELASPPVPPRVRALAAPIKAAELPKSGLRLSSEDALDEVTRSVTLLLPVDPEHCRPTTAAFEPFGARPEVVDSAEPDVSDFRGAVRVGERLVIWTADRLHVLDPGGAVDEKASLVLQQVLGPDLRPAIQDLALDPVPRANGARRLVFTVDRIATDGRVDSALMEASLSAAGALSFTGTATVVPPEHRDLEGVDVSEEGRAAFLSEEGVVYLEEASGAFSTLRLEDLTDNPKARSVVWTGDAARPLFVTSRDRIHVLDAATARFDAFTTTLSTRQSLHLYGAARVPGTSEIWAAGTRGYVTRWAGGPPEPVVPSLPPRYVECSQAQGDLALFVHQVEDLAAWGEHVYLILEACSAVMAVRRQDGCASLLPVLSDQVETVDGETEGLLGIRASEGRIVVVGRRGRVFQLIP